MALVDALLPEFDHEMTTTRKLLERVPDERLDWKPHAKSFSLGQLAQHLATLPMWGSMTINQSELDIAGNPPSTERLTRSQILARFDENVANTRAALTGKSDAELMAPWTLKREGHVIFAMPKASVWRSFVLSHIIHHRGQLTVYLRLNEAPVPAIYGPSADDTSFA